MTDRQTNELLDGIADMLSDVRGSTGNTEEKLDKVISLLESILGNMPLATQLSDLMPTLTDVLSELRKR